MTSQTRLDTTLSARPTLSRLLLLAAGMSCFISGAQAQSQAGGLALPGARRPVYCTEQFAPVCGRVGDSYRIYSNSCFARAAGAEIVRDGPCPANRTYRPLP
jgi:hypothetical protein